MTIRMSGMVSGMDTESLVSAMVSTYVSKKEKYQKAQTKLSYKQDAWKALNTKVYSLYSSISSLRLSSAYSMKERRFQMQQRQRSLRAAMPSMVHRVCRSSSWQDPVISQGPNLPKARLRIRHWLLWAIPVQIRQSLSRQHPAPRISRLVRTARSLMLLKP